MKRRIIIIRLKKKINIALRLEGAVDRNADCGCPVGLFERYLSYQSGEDKLNPLLRLIIRVSSRSSKSSSSRKRREL